ncbi:MAG: bifunctional (p)ppGpp synthetase/guanosine-3',5'-bis(diphosphate) 3'-pyrophosphohydrolase [Bacilli bacterium]|nr:bifunctional (p)ppGpp synthetase/guanosine-3',5'-bis(diphosphate) 3'-pyrophosphohydrolase [Bacilli bacterium]
MANPKTTSINGGYPLHTFEDIRDLYSVYISNPTDRELIEKAYKLALKKHEGVTRQTGEPYIHHPLEVCYILARLHVGPKTIAAGFLHDLVEDTDVTIEQIGKMFGKEVQGIVDALTKIQRLKLSHQDRINLTAEDHKKIFLGMSKDIRVIIIKLADRLHNMRTIDGLPPERIERLSRETIEVFVPIAHRLGIYSIQSELEDLVLKHLKPDIYREINTLVNKKIKNRKKSLDILMKRIADLLFEHKIPFEIKSRVKSIYSIYKKIYLKGRNFDEIYDILAIRIITDTELRCYEIIGLIHNLYKPIPGRFKDYIAVPKANMYQSLHTSIMSGDGHFFEVQVRTHEMNEIAETGVAAHWKYKEGRRYNSKREMKEIESRLHWFRDFVAMSGSELSQNASDYINDLRHDIFDSSVYVITPLGKVIDLPAGATPLDFAYKIHTRVGDQAVGAIVNNVMVPLNTVLKSGDIVEIKTNPNSGGPNEGWLKIAKSNSALAHIRKALAKKNSSLHQEERAGHGRTALKEQFAKFNFSEEEMLERVGSKSVLDYYQCKNMQELFVKVSDRNPTAAAVFEHLNLKSKRAAELKLDRIKKNPTDVVPVTIGGETRIAVSLGSCCTPIPGDDIVGYITKGKGVTIHRVNCPNIQHHPERLMEAEWNEQDRLVTYPVDIAIEANDRNNLLSDIMSVINQHNVPISAISAHLHSENLTSTINATIHVSDSKRLNDIFNVILNIPGVYDVARVIH